MSEEFMSQDQDLQTELANDYFIDQDTGAPVSYDLDSNDVIADSEAQPQGQQAQQPQDQQPTEQPQQQQELNPLQPPLPEAINFYSGEGEEQTFDAQKALNFFNQESRKPFEVQRVAPQPETVMQNLETPAGGTGDDLYKDVENFLAVVQQSLLTSTNIEEGINNARSLLNSQVANHLTNMQIKSLEEKLENQTKQYTEQQQMAMLEPNSRANLQMLAMEGKWGTAEDLKNVLLDQKYGGSHLTTMYRMMYPDKYKNLSDAEYVKDYNNFFVRMTSDPEAARMLEEVALSRLHRQNQAHIIKHTRKIADQEVQAKKVSRTAAVSNKSKPTFANKKQDSFDAWLNAKPGQ